MVLNASFWVLCAFLALLFLAGKRGWHTLSSFLDRRAQLIKKEIEEAHHQKKEAQNLLEKAINLQSEIQDHIQEIQKYAKVEIQRLKEGGKLEIEAHLKFEEYQLQERTRLSRNQFLAYVEQKAIAAAFQKAQEIIFHHGEGPLEETLLKKTVETLSHSSFSNPA